LTGSPGGPGIFRRRRRKPGAEGVLGVIVLLQALTVAVGGPPTSSEYLPLRVAEAEGHFAREGVQVTLQGARGDVAAAEALARGEVDLAASSLDPMLRFGLRLRSQEPVLVLGLTAAPPVALLVSTRLASPIRSVRDLAGRRVGVSAPGAPEIAWLAGLLSRARLSFGDVSVASLGHRRLAGALRRGDVDAALVLEPDASALVKDGHAAVLADLRTPDATARALDASTVNAAVFARRDRRPDEAALEAFARAVLAAEALIARESPAALAARLPPAVVGAPEEFARRVEASRALYLPGGRVSAQRLRESIDLIRDHMPLPATVRLPALQDLLHDAPVTRAGRPPER